MSKKATGLLFFLFITIGLYAQDMPVRTLPTEIFRSVKKDINDTATWRWKSGGIFNANFSQGTLSNWAAGGDNFTMAINTYTNYFLLNKGSHYTWDNSLDFYFGLIQTTSLGTRKNDDRFEILSKYGYALDTSKKFYASALFNLRTQFFDGYTYNGDSAFLSSSLLSPAYLFFAAGIDFKPVSGVSVFFSPLTDRMTIVASNKLYSKGSYGVPPYQHSINQVGAFASINVYRTVFKNITYKGKLDLFSDYMNNPENVDLYFTNYISFKINKFLSASYALDMIYDDDVRIFGKNNTSPALQLKSLIGIGFSMPIAPVVD